MNVWVLALILGNLAATTLAFIWLASRVSGGKGKKDKSKNPHDVMTERAEEDVEHIFNNEFREELRNRGRLHFEKIIGENAMFLQQDLRLTTSQLNEYMKAEITRTLQEEFAKYEESITDAKQLAIESISKTQEAIEQQRQVMGRQLKEEADKERALLVKRFEDNMANVVNHYVLAVIGDQIDLNDQLEFILAEFEANRAAIIRDINGGA